MCISSDARTKMSALFLCTAKMLANRLLQIAVRRVKNYAKNRRIRKTNAYYLGVLETLSCV